MELFSLLSHAGHYTGGVEHGNLDVYGITESKGVLFGHLKGKSRMYLYAGGKTKKENTNSLGLACTSCVFYASLPVEGGGETGVGELRWMFRPVIKTIPQSLATCCDCQWTMES